MQIIDKSHLLESNPLDLSYGATAQDFDKDGNIEIFVATQNGPNHLYKNINGKFVDVCPEILRDEECSAIGVASADMNGNGLPDIYVLNTGTFLGPLTEPDRLYINHGNFSFTDELEDHPDRNLGAGRSVCWTDPLGNNRPSLYLCNYGAPNLFFINGGGINQFRNMAAKGQGMGIIMGGRSVVSQDIRNQGQMDIFVLNENGPNLYFKNLGEGRFEESAAPLGLDDPQGHGRGIQIADIDRNGIPEIIWTTWEGQNRVMKLTAMGAYADIAPEPFATPGKTRTVLIGDFDNDGWQEIFVNMMEEPNRLYRITDGQITELDPGPLLLPDGAGTAATLADFDNDGTLELYICHGEAMPQRNKLFSAAPNGHNHIRIQPLSPYGGPAIGARVTLNHEHPMLRFIDGGSGYLCQTEPIAHFGLANEATSPSITIQWPDSAELTLENPTINQLHQVPHPASPDVLEF